MDLNLIDDYTQLLVIIIIIIINIFLLY